VLFVGDELVYVYQLYRRCAILSSHSDKFVRWRQYGKTCSFNQCTIQQMHSVIHHLRYVSTPTCFGTMAPSHREPLQERYISQQPLLVLLLLIGMRKILKCYNTYNLKP